MASTYYPAYNQYPYYNYYPMNQQNQQSYTQNVKSMEWVEGEVGARAFQMPSGWSANTPIPLWDSTQNRVYFKSWNQVGMANPLLYTDYPEVKELKNANALPESTSGDDKTRYATKQDFDELRQELKNLANSMNNNNNQNSRNRGG